MSERDPALASGGPETDEVAPPPALPVQSAIYITPDGKVQFGALFAELVPVARALDPHLRLPDQPAEQPADEGADK